MDKIIEGLYLGSISAPRNEAALQKANITHILSIIHGPVQLPPNLSLKHKQIEVEDYEDEDILQYIEEANSFIDEAINNGNGVLVHCRQGVSRSASFVAAYLMQKNGWSGNEAIEFIQSRRSFVWPNDGFLEQLDIYFKSQYRITPKLGDYKKWLARRDATAHQQDLHRPVHNQLFKEFKARLDVRMKRNCEEA